MISDAETRKNFDELGNFKADDDRQLMKCIEKFIQEDLKDKTLQEISVRDLDFKKFELKNERLKKMSKELLSLRSDIFLKFTKQFINASKSIDVSKEVKPGSMTYFFMKNKHLAFSSAKDKILDEKISDFCGDSAGFIINRNKASVFEVDKKVDHDGTVTIFGQIFQQCKALDATYNMF